MDKLIKYKLKRGIKKKGHILLGVAFFMAFLLGVVATFIYVWKNVVASIVNFSLLLIIGIWLIDNTRRIQYLELFNMDFMKEYCEIKEQIESKKIAEEGELRKLINDLLDSGVSKENTIKYLVDEGYNREFIVRIVGEEIEKKVTKEGG